MLKMWNIDVLQACGSIFVIDASAISKLGEAKEALNTVIEHSKMNGKPLLILANKQDCDGAIGGDQLREQLNLNSILGDHRRLSRVVST